MKNIRYLGLFILISLSSKIFSMENKKEVQRKYNSKNIEILLDDIIIKIVDKLIFYDGKTDTQIFKNIDEIFSKKDVSKRPILTDKERALLKIFQKYLNIFNEKESITTYSAFKIYIINKIVKDRAKQASVLTQNKDKSEEILRFKIAWELIADKRITNSDNIHDTINSLLLNYDDIDTLIEQLEKLLSYFVEIIKDEKKSSTGTQASYLDSMLYKLVKSTYLIYLSTSNQANISHQTYVMNRLKKISLLLKYGANPKAENEKDKLSPIEYLEKELAQRYNNLNNDISKEARSCDLKQMNTISFVLNLLRNYSQFKDIELTNETINGPYYGNL